MSTKFKQDNSLLGEVWVKIPVENYEVSNYGRVRHVRTMRILKPRLVANCGGAVVFLAYQQMGPRRSQRSVRKLVMDAFQLNPQQLPLIEHIDGDMMNCSVRNLRFRDYTRKHGKLAPSEKKMALKEAERAGAQSSWDRLVYYEQQDELRTMAKWTKGKPFYIEDGVYLKLPDNSRDTVTFNERMKEFLNKRKHDGASHRPQEDLQQPTANAVPPATDEDGS